MKKLRNGLIITIFTYLVLVSVTACSPRHSVEFLNEACIKPYKSYDYLTCDDMEVFIDGELYVVPKNFKTDLASIPRPLWSFIAPQYTGFVAPAILHDYLYGCGNLGDRKWSDEVLYSALLTQEVSKYTAMKFYIAVRLFGGSHFDEHNNFCEKVIYGQANA